MFLNIDELSEGMRLDINCNHFGNILIGKYAPIIKPAKVPIIELNAEYELAVFKKLTINIIRKTTEISDKIIIPRK